MARHKGVRTNLYYLDTSATPDDYKPWDGKLKNTSSDPVYVADAVLSDTPEFFEDTSFVTGDSPATLDLNAALGRNATNVVILNDGPGNFTYQLSNDGVTFGDSITIKQRERHKIRGLSIDSIKITWVSNSAYRVTAV